MSYPDPEGLPEDVVELRRQWRATGLMQGQIAEQLNLSRPTVWNVLNGKGGGKSRKAVEALFASMQNGNGHLPGAVPESAESADAPTDLQKNGVPIIVETATEAADMSSHACSAARILETIKLLGEAAENVCSLRKLLREAELHYNALVRKAAAVGIRIE